MYVLFKIPWLTLNQSARPWFAFIVATGMQVWAQLLVFDVEQILF